MLPPEKHPLWLRVTHWVNVPVLALLVWSGLLIYWANDVYPGFFPPWFYDFFHLNSRLAEGMGAHFLLAWLFTLNGLAYLAMLALSGHWRELLPDARALRDLWPTVLHDIGLRAYAPAQGKFNAAQRFAYSGAIALGIAAIFSGLAIYKPVQLGWLRAAFFGYQGARLVHFLAMLGLVAFTVVHVVQVARAGWRNFRAMVSGHENLVGARAFVMLGLFFALFAGAWTAARHAPDADNTPAPFRAAFEWNGRLWGAIYSPARSAACTQKPERLRENGDLGLEDSLDPATWTLELAADDRKPTTLRMPDLLRLPRAEAAVEFRCIEGWSTPISYAGARFSDFLRDRGIDPSAYRYVGLATPNGAYYVSVDMASMLHPQTVLAYELNGHPLTAEHGAPLRLVIPVKYGIKSLKRIGKIFLSNARPPDYWAEQGYDWHSGL